MIYSHLLFLGLPARRFRSMIRKLWLIFAQAVTVSAGIAVGLITVTDWRPFAPAQEAVHIPDFSSAVERAAPAVVTIFCTACHPGKACRADRHQLEQPS